MDKDLPNVWITCNHVMVRACGNKCFSCDKVIVFELHNFWMDKYGAVICDNCFLKEVKKSEVSKEGK